MRTRWKQNVCVYSPLHTWKWALKLGPIVKTPLLQPKGPKLVIKNSTNRIFTYAISRRSTEGVPLHFKTYLNIRGTFSIHRIEYFRQRRHNRIYIRGSTGLRQSGILPPLSIFRCSPSPLLTVETGQLSQYSDYE
jgi:hypothetical protein